MTGWFTADEFRCRCGRPACDAATGPAPRLLQLLNRMRESYGGPLVVTSGNRCAYWNQHEGGVEGSEHVRPGGCDAADLACPTSRDRWRMLDAARQAGFLRLGIGPTFLHVGVGSMPSDVQQVIWTYYPAVKA